MSLGGAPAVDGVISGAPVELPLEWVFNPWHERPGAATLAAVLTLGLCLLVFRAHQPLVLAVALCLAGAGALAPAFAPLRCRIDEQGIARLGPLGWERRVWGEFRRGVLRGTGLFLSPYARRHWLDPYRGIFLPLPMRGRARLTAAIQPLLERHGL